MLEALSAAEPLFTEDGNSRRVTALLQNFWGGVWGVLRPLICLLRKKIVNLHPPSLMIKETFLTDFASQRWFQAEPGLASTSSAVMDVSSQGYCHLFNRMWRDIKHENMSVWISLKIPCCRTSCKVIIHFRKKLLRIYSCRLFPKTDR